MEPVVPHFVFPRRLWKNIPWASTGSSCKLACPGMGAVVAREPKPNSLLKKQQEPKHLSVMTLLTTSLGVVTVASIVSCPVERLLAASVEGGIWRQPVVPLAQPCSTPLGSGTCRIWAWEATRCQGYSVAAVTPARCGTAGLTWRRQARSPVSPQCRPGPSKAQELTGTPGIRGKPRRKWGEDFVPILA